MAILTMAILTMAEIEEQHHHAHAAYYLLLTTYCLLLTAYCVLRTACYSIRTTIYIGAPPRLRGPLARQDEALPLARGARHERPAHDTLALPPRATRGHDLLGDGLR